jgi:hypothetical protein
MSGFHAVAIEGAVDPETLIRPVYGLDAGAALKPQGTGEFPGSSDSGTAGVASSGGWTIVVGGFPADLGSDEEAARLARLSRGRRLFRWAEQTTSGSVGLDHFADGEHLRSFWSVEGEVVETKGAPLEGEPEGGFEEADQSEVDVWSVVEVLEPCIGPWDPIGAAEYRMFSFGA